MNSSSYTLNEAQGQLADELKSVLRRYQLESDITTVEMLVVLSSILTKGLVQTDNRCREIADSEESEILNSYGIDTVLMIDLPLPPKELSPNVRCHHMAKANKVAQYRESARIASEAAMMFAEIEPPMWDRVLMQAVFYHKDARRRDGDNLLASLKSAFDGIRDAGVIVDDDIITHLPVKKRKDRDDPRLQISVYPVISAQEDE